MEFMRGERSVEDEDDLDDDAGECAFEIGEAVERGSADMDWMFVLHVVRIVKVSISITLFPLRVREIQLCGAHLRPPRLAPGPPPRAAPEGRLQVPRLGQSICKADHRVVDNKTF